MKERREKISRATATAMYYGFIDTEPENKSQNAKKCYRNLVKRIFRGQTRRQRKLDRDWLNMLNHQINWDALRRSNFCR